MNERTFVPVKPTPEIYPLWAALWNPPSCSMSRPGAQQKSSHPKPPTPPKELCWRPRRHSRRRSTVCERHRPSSRAAARGSPTTQPAEEQTRQDVTAGPLLTRSTAVSSCSGSSNTGNGGPGLRTGHSCPWWPSGRLEPSVGHSRHQQTAGQACGSCSWGAPAIPERAATSPSAEHLGCVCLEFQSRQCGSRGGSFSRSFFIHSVRPLKLSVPAMTLRT